MGILCCCVVCFNFMSSKALEINLIIMSSILSFLLFLCLIIIKWKKISVGNVLLFILMFLISLGNIVISSFLRYWRAKNLIKTTKKVKGVKLAIAGFVSIIICFIVNIIEEFVFSISYYKVKDSCYSGRGCKYGLVTSGELFFSYLAFTCLELYLIYGMFIYWLLKGRIEQGLDGPVPEGTIGRQAAGGAMYDQYGRQVVVVQPGDVVVMDGQRNIAVPMDQYNQYNNPNSNQYNNQYNQYNTPISNHFNNQFNNQNNNQYNNNLHNDINNEDDLHNMSAQVHPEKPDSQEYKLN